MINDGSNHEMDNDNLEDDDIDELLQDFQIAQIQQSKQ